MSASDHDLQDSLIRSTFVRPAETRQHVQTRYTMADLETLTGFSSRTIRFYIQEGLIPAAHGRGPTATYDREHLLRLMRIAELKTEVGALSEIRTRLGSQSTEELEAHFSALSGPEEERWRRVKVHPRLELHVREGREPNPRFEQALEQIVQHARIVLEHYENGRS